MHKKAVPFMSGQRGAGEISLRPDGVWQVYIQDSDGFRIEINDAKYCY